MDGQNRQRVLKFLRLIGGMENPFFSVLQKNDLTYIFIIPEEKVNLHQFFRLSHLQIGR